MSDVGNDSEVVAALARRWYDATKSLEKAIADQKEERAARERLQAKYATAKTAIAAARCESCDPSYGCFWNPAACSKIVGSLAALRAQHHGLLQVARATSTLVCVLLECEDKKTWLGPAVSAAMGGVADWILAGLHDLPELAEAREALVRAGWTGEATQDTADLTAAAADIGYGVNPIHPELEPGGG